MLSPKKARLQSTYETSCLKKLKPQEAKQFILHHAKQGDPGAKDLLALILPGKKNSRA